MTKKTITPQIGRALRYLRNSLNLSQSSIANKLEDTLYSAVKVRHSIQQADISRLETEKSAIKLPELLAYSLLFNVNVTELLSHEFNLLLQSSGGIRLHTFHDDNEAEKKLTELEQNERIMISPEFPSSLFRLHKNSPRFQQLNSQDYEATEMYTAEAFLQFLFSPVSPFGLKAKQQILEACMHYFQANINRRLYFFSGNQLPQFNQLPTMVLLPQREALLVSAPASCLYAGDAFVEISDKSIYANTARFYRRLPTLENSLGLLRIGSEALDRLTHGDSLETTLISFSRELLSNRDQNALNAIGSFTPELQTLINNANNAS